MTVKDVYDFLCEDYNNIYERIEDDGWIAKYLKQFLCGAYYEKLQNNVNEKNGRKYLKMLTA